jgi:hypothetical protein
MQKENKTLLLKKTVQYPRLSVCHCKSSSTEKEIRAKVKKDIRGNGPLANLKVHFFGLKCFLGQMKISSSRGANYYTLLFILVQIYVIQTTVKVFLHIRKYTQFRFALHGEKS